MTKQMPAILALLFLAMSIQVQAQVDFGFRSGVNFNTISQTQNLNTVTPDIDYLIGFSGAIYAELPFSETLSFQPEIAYTQKGFSIAQGADLDLFGNTFPVGVRANSKFNYLELPLLLKANFGSEQLKAFVIAGPNLGYALNGNVKTEADGFLDINLSNNSIDLDAINYQRFEVAGVVGAGLSYDAGFGKLNLDARFQQGFTELYDIPLVGEKVKNRSFGINLGLAIPLN